MIYISKLFRNGQTTIPLKVREVLGIYPGDELIFILEKDSIILKKSSTTHAFDDIHRFALQEWYDTEDEDLV